MSAKKDLVDLLHKLKKEKVLVYENLPKEMEDNSVNYSLEITAVSVLDDSFAEWLEETEYVFNGCLMDDPELKEYTFDSDYGRVKVTYDIKNATTLFSFIEE